MRIRTKVLLGVASVLVAVGALFALNTQAMSDFRNCNPDAIIKCGAISQSELLQKYDNNVGDVKHVYAYYGITRADLAGDLKVGTVYQDGRVVVDGKTVATGAFSVSRIKYTSAGEPKPVTINGTTYYEGPSMAIFTGPVDAFVIFKNGQFYKAVLSSCGNPLLATPEKPEIKPVYTCDLLTATQGKIDREYNFKAVATAKDGAKIVSYSFEFGDGATDKVVTTAATATSSHTYADKAATYTAKVTVNFNVLGADKINTNENCEKTITIKEKPVTPVYRCDNLEPRRITTKENTYEYTVSYTAEGGASLTKIVYDFGDKSATKTMTNAAPVQHTFTQPGTYRTVATLYFTTKTGENGPTQSVTCEATVKIVPPEMCDIKPTVPKDSPECTPCKYNPELPADSDKCVPPVTPPELPKTGLETFLGGGLGLASLTSATCYFVGSRKNLLNALLNK